MSMSSIRKWSGPTPIPPSVWAAIIICRPAARTRYTWSPSVGLTDPNIADPYATPPATTTYTVAGTDSARCFTERQNVCHHR